MSVSKYANLVLEKIESGEYSAKHLVECFTRFNTDEDIRLMLENECLLESCLECGDTTMDLNENMLCEECQEENKDEDNREEL